MNEEVRNNKYLSTAKEFREQIDHFLKVNDQKLEIH